MFLAFFCISICDGYQTVVPHHQIRRPLSLAGRDSYATCSETQHLYLNATLIIIESLDIAQHPTTNDICAEFGQAPLHRTRNGSSLDELSGCWQISQPNWTCREWWVTSHCRVTTQSLSDFWEDVHWKWEFHGNNLYLWIGNIIDSLHIICILLIV